MRKEPPSMFRTVRGYQLETQREDFMTPANEDYLEMVYRRHLEGASLRIARLSELLNVKPPSASKAVAKLTRLGYMRMDENEVIRLSEKGLKLGCYLYERHNAAEGLLQLLGSADALKEAELLEHALSARTVRGIQALLSMFARYPELSMLYERIAVESGK
ncbi:MAG: metal-dependent transcriptional regulator [Clostridiaceae bacterium]|nr:metal-dependent transcriptional regulator [Eubacteriales bacterium]